MWRIQPSQRRARLVERYDQSFPDHPLSQVRRRMADVVKTMKLDASGGPYQPFRIRKGWKFW